VTAARLLGARLRRGGASVALYPRDWAQVAAGVDIVVGARAAVWAPIPELGAVVVLDEHDEAMKEERVPCWHARDVAIERARRAAIPCVLVSPCPSLEALDIGRLITMSRNDERAAWPIVEMADLSKGVISEALARHIRNGDRIVGVLNRKGRARLLACAACATLARCERCSAAVGQDEAGNLVCRRCGTVRPAVCLACGAARFKVLRPGVARVRDELEALAGEPVVDITAANDDDVLPAARIFVGTEAVLHRVAESDVVAFLDFDDELLAPRYRADEQALGLLARAARVVGGRSEKGRVLVQTRLDSHEVIDAALHADPGRLVPVVRARREALGFPPYRAMAEISGAAAATFIDALGTLAAANSLTIDGPSEGHWLVRASDADTLADALAAVPRPQGRLRIEVDPLRV
jgi:primosomal protein N' (replication factor Y)